MNNIKQMIFSNWHFMRIIRFAFGIILGINAIVMHDAFSAIIAIVFLFQAFTNTGCCGASCAVPINRNNKKK